MSVRKRTGIPPAALHAPYPAGSSPKNVVVFGESGVGKSSLINLIAGRSIAATSSGAKGCTFEHKTYEFEVDDTPYAVWDTAGLDEGTYGTVPAEIAEENLKYLLHDLTRANGLHLLVYCVRGARLRQTLLGNYNLFYSAICRKKVPIVLVVTGLENYEDEMEDWWVANGSEFAKLKMHFDGHACVTTLDVDKVNSPMIKRRCHTSRQALRDLITNTCARDALGNEREGWMSAAVADVRAMFRSGKHNAASTPLAPVAALYDFSEPGGDHASPPSSAEGGHMMDVGGSPLIVYRVRKRHLGAGAQFRKRISPRGADLLIFCTSMRTDPVFMARESATVFYRSYGGETRPLLVVVRDAVSDEAALAWWNSGDDDSSRSKEMYASSVASSGTGRRALVPRDCQAPAYALTRVTQLSHDAGAGRLQVRAIVHALPPPGSLGWRGAVGSLQRAIQTRALHPLEDVPTGCFSWLGGGRRRTPKIHPTTLSGTGSVDADWLTKFRVWGPWMHKR